ncbi:uncharacterized protein [Miscanthus floridulus]|uniref:uncharacterized protein n=1 Tax=Miscanthus floridulus TaxID=154761 RepID=UPI00345AAAD7
MEAQELVAQVEATQVAMGREEEEEPTLREAVAPTAVEATVGAAETPSAMEATEGEVEVEAPSVVEATEGEVEVEASTVAEATKGEVEVEASTVAEALRTSGAEVVEIAAPGNFGAEVVEAGGSTQEAEVRPIPADNASWGKGVADAGAASAVEQPASGEGSAALVRVRPEPYGWDHPRIWWRSRDDPKGEPIFALEDVAEGGRWDTLEQYRSLAERSLRTALSVVANDLPGVSRELKAWSFGKSLFLQWERGVWDELCRTREEASRAAEASRVEVQRWKEKAKGLDDEVSRLTEASVALQTVLDREIEEHEVLQSAAHIVCKALEMEGVQLGSSLRSRLTALIGQARQRLREALHTGVKCALAVVSSHYAGIDVEGVSDGYVLSEDAVEAEEELTRLEAAVEGPSTALAKLFEEEVVPPSPSADAGDPAP